MTNVAQTNYSLFSAATENRLKMAGNNSRDEYSFFCKIEKSCFGISTTETKRLEALASYSLYSETISYSRQEEMDYELNIVPYEDRRPYNPIIARTNSLEEAEADTELYDGDNFYIVSCNFCNLLQEDPDYIVSMDISSMFDNPFSVFEAYMDLEENNYATRIVNILKSAYKNGIITTDTVISIFMSLGIMAVASVHNCTDYD